jgi:hypothetical protein
MRFHMKKHTQQDTSVEREPKYNVVMMEDNSTSNNIGKFKGHCLIQCCCWASVITDKPYYGQGRIQRLCWWGEESFSHHWQALLWPGADPETLLMGGGELQSSLTSLTMARGRSRDSVDGGRGASVITDKPYYGQGRIQRLYWWGEESFSHHWQALLWPGVDPETLLMGGGELQSSLTSLTMAVRWWTTKLSIFNINISFVV